MAMNGSKSKPAGRSRGASTPLLEWISGAIGLAILLATIGFLGWGAFTRGAETPALEAAVERVVSGASGHTVVVAVRNTSAAMAADVEVEGRLAAGDDSPLTSTAKIDYVPGRSTRRVGLVFEAPPAAGALEVRVLGYREP